MTRLGLAHTRPVRVLHARAPASPIFNRRRPRTQLESADLFAGGCAHLVKAHDPLRGRSLQAFEMLVGLFQRLRRGTGIARAQIEDQLRGLP